MKRQVRVVMGEHVARELCRINSNRTARQDAGRSGQHACATRENCARPDDLSFCRSRIAQSSGGSSQPLATSHDVCMITQTTGRSLTFVRDDRSSAHENDKSGGFSPRRAYRSERDRRFLGTYFASAAFTATRRSATKCLYSRSRDSSSGWRRSEEG